MWVVQSMVRIQWLENLHFRRCGNTTLNLSGVACFIMFHHVSSCFIMFHHVSLKLGQLLRSLPPSLSLSCGLLVFQYFVDSVDPYVLGFHPNIFSSLQFLLWFLLFYLPSPSTAVFFFRVSLQALAEAVAPGPPSWKKQLQAILSVNARGTVEEFHDLLSSLQEEHFLSDIESKSEDSDGAVSNKSFVSLCAAVLSAQTRDRAAIGGIQRLSDTIGLQSSTVPDFSPAAIALAPPSLIEQCLKGVNYFKTKAKHLTNLAALLLTKHSGRVPQTFDELRALPGVGAKVANLVLSVTFGRVDAGMVVDTHVHRVARRLGWSDASVPEKTRKDLEEFMSFEIREHATIRLIAFGQEICRPQYPKCSICPVAKEQLCPTYARRIQGHTGSTNRRVFSTLRPSPKSSRKRIFIELDETWMWTWKKWWQKRLNATFEIFANLANNDVGS